MCNVVQLCLAANNILLMREIVGHLLGLRHAFLPYVGEDCVTSQKNVCVGGQPQHSLRGRRSKGKVKESCARPPPRNALPVPFQTPATQATSGPEGVLGLLGLTCCVQSKSSRKIRNAQFVIREFSAFLEINTGEHLFSVNSFYPIYG